MPCGADGSVRGVGIPSASLGAGSSTPRTDSLCESVGCAQDDNPSKRPPLGLKPVDFLGALRGAEAPLFHGGASRRGQGGRRGLNGLLKNSDAPAQRLKALLKTQRFTVCLKAYPDTNRALFSKLKNPNFFRRPFIAALEALRLPESTTQNQPPKVNHPKSTTQNQPRKISGGWPLGKRLSIGRNYTIGVMWWKAKGKIVCATACKVVQFLVCCMI